MYGESRNSRWTWTLARVGSFSINSLPRRRSSLRLRLTLGTSSLPFASLPSWSRSRVFSEKPAAFQFASIWSTSPTTPFKGGLWLAEKSRRDHRRLMSVSCITQVQRLRATSDRPLALILVESLDRFRWLTRGFTSSLIVSFIICEILKWSQLEGTWPQLISVELLSQTFLHHFIDPGRQKKWLSGH